MELTKELQNIYVDRLYYQFLRFKYIFKHIEERQQALNLVLGIIAQLRSWPELEDNLRFIPPHLQDSDDFPDFLEVFLFNLDPDEFDENKRPLIQKLKKALFYALPKLKINLKKESESFEKLSAHIQKGADLYQNNLLKSALLMPTNNLHEKVDTVLHAIEQYLLDKVPHHRGLIISKNPEFITEVHQYLNLYYLSFETANNLHEVKECLYSQDISFILLDIDEITPEIENMIKFISKSPFYYWLNLIAVVPAHNNTVKTLCYINGIQHVIEKNHLPETLIPLAQTLIQSQQVHRSYLKVDPQSRIPTYRNLYDYFEQAQAFAGRIGSPLSFAIIELEHYDKIMNEQGAYITQTWLREYFQQFSTRFRRTDRIGLWRPDKFIVLLPNTPAQGAVFIMEKFLREQKSHQFLDHQEDNQSFYAGIVQLQQDVNFEEAVHMAYDALDKAKKVSVNNIYCPEHRLSLKSPPHILLVDDDHMVASIIARCFEKENYKVSHIPRGEDALKFLEKTDLSLIILDLKMPGMDGYEVLEKIRSQRKYDDLPVVVLSSMQQEDDIIRSLELGANDFLSKPFSTPLILAKIARYFK